MPNSPALPDKMWWNYTEKLLQFTQLFTICSSKIALIADSLGFGHRAGWSLDILYVYTIINCWKVLSLIALKAAKTIHHRCTKPRMPATWQHPSMKIMLFLSVRLCCSFVLQSLTIRLCPFFYGDPVILPDAELCRYPVLAIACLFPLQHLLQRNVARHVAWSRLAYFFLVVSVSSLTYVLQTPKCF